MPPRKQADLRARVGRRIDKALNLQLVEVGPGQFLVWGGAEPHYVNLSDPKCPACDCGSREMAGAICCHMIRARLEMGESLSPRGLQRGIRADALAVEMAEEARRAEYHAKLAAAAVAEGIT